MSTAEKLPYRVIQLATDLFADTYGLSHNEITDFFCYEMNQSPNEIEIPRSVSNRSDRFKFYLGLFPADQQRKLLIKLCNNPDSAKWHARPPEAKTGELRSLLGNVSMVSETTTEIITEFNAVSVSELWKKAHDRLSDDPDGAITAARSLLESTCKHLLDKISIKYDDSWDLPRLYKSLAKELRLSPSDHTEDIFRQILGGCQSVIEGLGALRNKHGDAHGSGITMRKPKKRHAELAVNLAESMAIFLIETWQAQKK